MAITASDSVFPLVRAATKIAGIRNRSSASMGSTQKSYQDLVQFIGIETQRLKSIQFSKKKLKKLQGINVASNFGRPGNLLSSLASGALDAASFVGDFFGRNRKVGPKAPAGRPIPQGPKIRFGGVRALGIANAAFAGLDFATGLAEGESVGKAAAGAGGALAGSLLGGVIGQSLIPIPGVGFMVGSALGGMAGGWLGDRAYEGGEKVVSAISGSEQLREQQQRQKIKAAQVSPQMGFSDVLDQFESVVTKFERASFGSGTITSSGPGTSEGENYGPGSDPNAPTGPGSEDVTLDGEGTFIQGSTGKSTGPHFHIGPTELYDPVGDVWVNKKTEQGKVAAREAAFKIAKGFIARKKYFRFTNAGIDVMPGKAPDDKTLRDYILREQNAHANRSGGGSWGGLDIAGEAGLRLPVPVGDVTWSKHGYGYAARIQGTNAFVGHGMKGSKKTPDAQTLRSTTQGQGQPVLVATGTNDYQDPAKVEIDTKKILQELRNKGYTPILVPPNKGLSSAAHEASVRAASAMGVSVEKGAYSSSDPLHLTMDSANALRQKYSGAEVIGDSNAVRIAGGSMQNVAGKRVQGAHGSDILQYAISLVKAKPSQSQASQVSPSQQQVVAPQQMQQLQQYPTYNTQRETTTIIPISSSSSKSPMVISPGGSGGGDPVVVMPGPSEAQVLNSLFKTMLLTNLSST